MGEGQNKKSLIIILTVLFMLQTDIHIIDPEWELPHIPKALDSDSDSGSSKDIIDVDNLQAKQK